MDKAKSAAITAIRNIKLESFVVTALEQLGWSLIYRATGPEGLFLNAQRNPSALIITADDFGLDKNSLSNPIITLENAMSLREQEFHELLRRVDKDIPIQGPVIPPCSTSVSVVATVKNGIGGSTSATNIAYEKSHRGSKTLLLDFNTQNPALALYFDIQRINRSIEATPFGFFLGEVSELSHLALTAEEANKFDEVVIDLGKLPHQSHLSSGVRIHEILTRWSLQSASHLFLVSPSDESSLRQLQEITPQSLQLAGSAQLTILLASQIPISGRKRRTINERVKDHSDFPYRHLPHESQGISRAAAEKAPLAYLLPKSPLAVEISSLCRPQSNQGREHI